MKWICERFVFGFRLLVFGSRSQFLTLMVGLLEFGIYDFPPSELKIRNSFVQLNPGFLPSHFNFHGSFNWFFSQ